jgi:hypothetical protein
LKSALAADWVMPTTFGTASIGAPLETTNATLAPEATLAPAAGDSLITMPEDTVELAC